MNDANNQTPSVYFFGEGRADGGDAVKHLVGGKGASLAEMTKAGLNVPPGFTISAACCERFFPGSGRWPAGLEDEVRAGVARLEQVAGRPFGKGDDPLLVAVRSGAAQSMPGMMDTVLNVGLNPECVEAMGRRTGNRRGAWEAYRHFLTMFGPTVGGVAESVFDGLIADALRQAGKASEDELDAEEMMGLCEALRAAYRTHAGRDLPDDPWEMLRQAIDAVFHSWYNDRAVAYRRDQRIEGLLGTAVNVQMMCPSEVSGVMFTANPVNPARGQIIIESSYGLGEAVVLGKVTPDRFVLDKQTLRIAERVISVKDQVTVTLARDGVGQTGARDAASLGDEQITELARLGLRVEGYFGTPCDVEWALSQGRFYLLQARPIKGLEKAAAAVGWVESSRPTEGLVGLEDSTHPTRTRPPPEDRERVRREEITALEALAKPGGTVWARFNLAEVLPEPTPMTWAIVRCFMSGRGGYGQMYRDLGFEPDSSLDEAGVYDLVCGRPYCNLDREPLLYARGQPLEHSFADLKAAPHKAVAYPQAKPNWARAAWHFWLLQPLHFVKSVQFAFGLQNWSRTFAERLRREVLPGFADEFAREAAVDLTKLDGRALLEKLDHLTRRTLTDFARDSLKPTVLAAVSMGNLETLLARALGTERARAALGELTMGARPDPDADLPAAVQDLAAGRLDRAAFLERFGHRGSQEMELSRPRWSEEPAALDRLIAQGSGAAAKGEAVDPKAAWQRIAAEAKVPAWQSATLEAEVLAMHTYLGLRETAKHHLMRGYALIRRVLVELDRRHALDGGIFFLTREELPQLVKGEDFAKVIEERRRRREAALELEMPQVLFSDDLEAIGRPVEVAGADTLRGVPLSAGVAEAAALVLDAPTSDLPAEPFILVCRSTDPAWVPLFGRAKGLVMETGGVLSHGAIVARDYGLPAVAGLPDVQRRLRSGQRLRVDGATGTVTVLPPPPRPTIPSDQ